ncbi:hypothetical protein CGLO_17922 [Colletotrichum gloeosporioides Cg-14]|uniref:Uncharacterized protein n=1 Tax=Colletotrichum gloeosporioides (strain Cg-14) TaxID=1237896 RepID=T0JJ43_COLGC|nr:hypothetical protein CGLO_17922 [Colletotrichum gloeosporioides Cg-14]
MSAANYLVIYIP